MDDYMNDGQEAEAPVEESDKDGERTALLPIDFFQGKTLEPGSTCEVRIDKVYEDQVSVVYVPHREEAQELASEMGAPVEEEYLS